MAPINRLALILALVCSQTVTAAADPVRDDLVTRALECRLTEDKVARLFCFDALFQTPADRLPAEPRSTPPRPRGQMRSFVDTLEQTRTPEDIGWLTRLRPWSEPILLSPEDMAAIGAGSPANDEIDVFLTMREMTPSTETGEEDAILLLSCENDITTLGVLLPKPISTLRADLTLSGQNGTAIRLNWRHVENGDVLIAGRGLESIDTIKTIAGFEAVHLKVAYPDGEKTYVFAIGDLKQRLLPLRSACHW